MPLIALLLVLLGVLPRWAGREALMDAIARASSRDLLLRIYAGGGWALMTAAGVCLAAYFIRSTCGPARWRSGTITIHRDRVEIDGPRGGLTVFPFAATPYVRDLFHRGCWIEVRNPRTNRRSIIAGPAWFATQAEYSELSLALQRAHSDFWLGGDFPTSIGRLDLDFGGGRTGGELCLRQGILHWRGDPLPRGAITSYHVDSPVFGASYRPLKTEVTIDLDVGGRRAQARLLASRINHKLSLLRILDAWGAPQR